MLERFQRWPIRATLLLLAVSVVASAWWQASLSTTAGWQASLAQPQQIFRPAPEWQEGVGECRSDPLAHVPSPRSLDVIRACATVAGVIRSIDRDARSQNLEIILEPDPQVARLLDPRIQRYVRVTVLPTDQASMVVPPVDQHAAFFGSWVVNRRAAVRGTLELRPAWLVTAANIAGPVQPRPTLSVVGRLPASVQTGSLVEVAATVESTAQQPAKPVSQATVYVELRTALGEAQRWRATRTNSLGTATISLAAIEAPGEYTLWVYAAKGRDVGTTQVQLRIVRGSG
jgi:hypothetical protein